MFFMFRRVYLRYRVFIAMSATIIVCFIQGLQFMNEISETDILAQIRSEMNIHFRSKSLKHRVTKHCLLMNFSILRLM